MIKGGYRGPPFFISMIKREKNVSKGDCDIF